MVCHGPTGMGLMRSALSWSPVMALATTQQISLVLMAPSMTSVACLTEWDKWRENGVCVSLPFTRGTHDKPLGARGLAL